MNAIGTGFNTAREVLPVPTNVTGYLSGKTISKYDCGQQFCIVLTSDNTLLSWGNAQNGNHNYSH
jgi:alpha-tubulin suppressor-like RCC1 family protein